MIVEDQGEIIAFLSRPRAYGAGASAVERLETHVSVIFLTGERAYKLKRAVRFPYLDFSTSALRRAACEAEVAVNRRTAPGMYLGVVAVTREPGGGLRLGGGGAPVDWLVEMTRFDQDTLFDRLARLGALDRPAMEDLADAIARLHGEAEKRVRGGGHAGMGVIVDGNAETFAECANGVLDPVKVERLNVATRRALDGCAALLDARRAGGRVRHCHGDLHLRNIFRMDGKPTLFDAIEFNPVLSEIDVLYDLAFVLMDLDHRGLRRLASIALNRYLDVTGDTAGLGALGLFLSVRAAIRSHVEAAAAATRTDRAEARRSRAESRAYLDRALAYLAPAAPVLVAVGGFSGTGKSRLARELAPFLGPPPGARVVRSDVIRKRLAGVDLLARLGPEGYSAAMTERTYGTLYEEARTALEAGYAVIADAVFARPGQRRAVAEISARTHVPFHGLGPEAPLEARQRRVTVRRRNVSDADAGLVRAQAAYDVGEIDWERIDSSGPKDETLGRGRALIGL